MNSTERLRPPAGLQERGIPRQRRCASAAHPCRVPRADARVPPRARLRHDRVLRLGARWRPTGRSATTTTRRANSRAWSRPGRRASRRTVIATSSAPAAAAASWRPPTAAHPRPAARRIGLNIGLPHEQRPNPYITPELTFEFHYFFMRKLWFAHLARALVVFPGRLRHARRADGDPDADADQKN